MRLLLNTGLCLLALCCVAQAALGQPRRAPEVRFDAGGAARAIPFELHRNHVYLRVRVNDSGPLLFILDTGASSVISLRLARSLGLRLRAGEGGYGVGETAVETAAADGVTLRLPGVALARQTLAATSLDDLRTAEGREVEGILGYGFFRRLVVEIDHEARVVNLYSPRRFRYRGRGRRVPLVLDAESGLVFARARVKPQGRAAVRGLFEIDSGGGHALILNRPFAERHGLLAGARPEDTTPLGGLGGTSRAVAGMVESLTLGGERFDNVLTFFSLASEGMLASDEFDGSIGNGVLRHFKVVFDYSRRLLILEGGRPR
ncbi:MAG TPA: aspartyl protease family protein [Pyrinomonadaceae bacterium]|jgi:hypothetical protein|nr:aspartyl protease family protein [Pyrinomonadaceae bacterium]